MPPRYWALLGGTTIKQRYDNILQTIGHTPSSASTSWRPVTSSCSPNWNRSTPWARERSPGAGCGRGCRAQRTLTPGQTVVEATSGNTGIGLAMVVREGLSAGRRDVRNFQHRAPQADAVSRCPGRADAGRRQGSGMVAKAEELARLHGRRQPRQFENPANAETHARTTAVEILGAFEDLPLDYWVTGFGTGGTLSGVCAC